MPLPPFHPQINKYANLHSLLSFCNIANNTWFSFLGSVKAHPFTISHFPFARRCIACILISIIFANNWFVFDILIFFTFALKFEYSNYSHWNCTSGRSYLLCITITPNPIASLFRESNFPFGFASGPYVPLIFKADPKGLTFFWQSELFEMRWDAGSCEVWSALNFYKLRWR